jgi:small-conductance mechanosensitive channel
VQISQLLTKLFLITLVIVIAIRSIRKQGVSVKAYLSSVLLCLLIIAPITLLGILALIYFKMSIGLPLMLLSVVASGVATFVFSKRRWEKIKAQAENEKK